VDGVAVVDGQLVPLAQAALPVTDVQVTHGLGVYETLEVRPGIDVAPNLVRLAESARAIGVAVPGEQVLRREIAQVHAAIGGPAWVRINLTGDGRRIVWGTPVDPARRHVGVRAGRAPHVDHPLLAGAVKQRSRGPWEAEVRRRKVDDLLFVDADGRFTEGSSCAVLAVISGTVWTAPWDGRILRSTTLERLLGHARELGIAVFRQGAPAAGPWDGLYVASSTRSLSPVIELDGAALRPWEPVGRKLAEAADRAVGLS
jgi:branched-subunit amino acid aminotransferase/4-amino-4-deoxychorismate lyase